MIIDEVFSVACNITAVVSSLSSFHLQSVMIDRCSTCTHNNLTYCMVAVFCHWTSISCPYDTCSWSSHTLTGEDELMGTDTGLSVEGCEEH